MNYKTATCSVCKANYLLIDWMRWRTDGFCSAECEGAAMDKSSEKNESHKAADMVAAGFVRECARRFKIPSLDDSPPLSDDEMTALLSIMLDYIPGDVARKSAKDVYVALDELQHQIRLIAQREINMGMH